MTADLSKIAAERGIKYFLISYVDLFGFLRAKLAPASAIAGMQKNGAGFAGFASHLDHTPAHSDTLAVPDPASLIQLPWKPEVGWVAADLYCDGVEVHDAPRAVLKKQIAKAKALGYQLKTGVECEFFLLTKDGKSIADPADLYPKPCYDQQALMRQYDLITGICDAMQTLGWKPYQNDHEDANGQFEMNWEYDDVLLTADRHTFFKYMVKTFAEEAGYRATFMPKPFNGLTGSGCHIHASLWKGGVNVFEDPKGELGLSPLAYNFLGGVIHSAAQLCALFNPTVNSFKRINAPRTVSGASWSPNTITYGGNNRTHMVRIPEPNRFEFRILDGATNPYLGPAAILMAGLDGIENKRDPGKRLDIDMYAEGYKIEGAPKLPLNLLDALRMFNKSEVARAGFGDRFVDSYVKLKMESWNDFMSHATEWERLHTLDC
ncbi:type III glutamate--ammonia ligase [Rhodoblastus sphagnicola]|uniref:Type III glutamate--ammonia ligase n=1 Tax=Rhodoblastus sphagnicola TaxID=333368 RepID=A0A2S6NA22_9HYPH|nr:type III glutamate--ammonia ligase [Rhodoblastus sphagnicola]MBB4198845.1 glutamine synthetase [Rhodoblastus sphagnicola]PPQ31468.1 type III glutamate--ammonia ligase [Rhodoblastus sphagnicola]